MKKLILLLGILSMGFQCGEEPALITNSGEWVVKNSSGKALILHYRTTYQNIPSGGTILLYHNWVDIWDKPEFDNVLAYWGDWAEPNISFSVLSSNGSELVEWDYPDRDGGSKQFFNAGSWIYSENPADRVDEIKCVWLFEIKAEDLAQ